MIESGKSWAYARFLDRNLGRGRDFVSFDDRYSQGSQRVAAQMSEHMTALSPPLREERLRMIQTLQLGTLADLEHRIGHSLADNAAAAITVAALIEAVAVLLVAPSDIVAADR